MIQPRASVESPELEHDRVTPISAANRARAAAAAAEVKVRGPRIVNIERELKRRAIALCAHVRGGRGAV